MGFSHILLADTQHMYSNIIYTIFGNSKRIIIALGGGNRLNAVENTTIGAQKRGSSK